MNRTRQVDDLYQSVKSIPDPDAFQRVIDSESDDFVLADLRDRFWNGKGEKPWQVKEINRLITRRKQSSSAENSGKRNGKNPLSTSSWWKTLPGIGTASAALITAIGGFILILFQIGYFKPVTNEAKTESCVQLFDDLVGRGRPIEATVNTMNVDGVASYARLVMTFAGGAVPQFSGKGTQVFNDRKASPSQLFDENRSDSVEMEIFKGEHMSVVFTLLSWNNSKITFQPECEAELMHGFARDGKTYFVIHFR